MIGDHPSDVLFGINAGTQTIFLLTGNGKKHFEDLKQNKIKPNIITDSFLKAARLILSKN